jgi:cell wall-associated NlpC family hydrolase
VASTRVVRSVRTMIGSLVVVGIAIVVPLAAHATPDVTNVAAAKPLTSAQVTAKLHDLAVDSEKLSEQLNRAKIDIAAAKRLVIVDTQRADLAQANLHDAQQQLAISIASQYKAASFSRTIALLSANSSDSYLQTVQSMSLLTQHQSEVATIASDAITAANQATAQARTAVVAATQKQADLARRQMALNAEVAKYQALLATLTVVQRAQYFAPAAATPSQSTISTVLAAIPPGSSAAGKAIAVAKAQLGKPYVWGASGPDSFDCSGLTAYAWGAAGVGLPHNAAAQQGMGMSVSQADLAPGDLVFFGSPAYHVGIYLGGGLMIHAPTSGDVVRIVNLANMPDYSGARRVG